MFSFGCSSDKIEGRFGVVMIRRELRIGEALIGDGHPCFVTFEAGPTHDGLETAIGLVREAAAAGADAIKFQIFDADKLIEDKQQLFEYEILINKLTGERSTIKEPLYDIFKRRQLTLSEWRKVKSVADSLGLAFFATVGFEEDLNLLIELKVQSLKIASADINHFPFLRLAARSGINIQLDTGNSEINEIQKTVDFLEKEGCSSIIIHQCPSGYPARVPSICLKMIGALRSLFPQYPIAYSDHTPDADMDIAAVALGANLIEKTITFDQCIPSIEHIFSLEPRDMKSFISRIRDVELAQGVEDRRLTAQQKISRNLIRRGAYLKRDVGRGESVKLSDFIFRRPCRGISTDALDQLIERGCTYKDFMEASREIHASDLSLS